MLNWKISKNCSLLLEAGYLKKHFHRNIQVIRKRKKKKEELESTFTAVLYVLC